MPDYSYSAYDHSGQRVKGTITAPSRSEAVQQLEGKNFFIESMSSSALSQGRRGGVKSRVFLNFNKELASMLRAGLPLVESLSIVGKRGDQKEFAAVIQQVTTSLKEGMSLADACSKYPEIFDEIYISNLKTGEKSGRLYEALNEYQKHLNQRLAFRSKLRRAMAYPAFLVVTLGIVLIFLFVFIVPSFSKLFASFNAQLPLATRIVIRGAHLFPFIALGIGLVALLIFGFLRMNRDREGVQRKLDAFKMNLPLAGVILRNSRYVQLARNMATMLSAGMPLLVTLENLQMVYQKTSMGPVLASVKDHVMNGIAFHEALQNEGLMTEQAIKLIEVGENSGELERMLSEVADFYEGEMDERLAIITSLFEPALMLVIGFVVGGIIVSMYLPIFYLADVVK